MHGGERGIRTLGTLARSTVFETAPFDHSGTSPQHFLSIVWSNMAQKGGRTIHIQAIKLKAPNEKIPTHAQETDKGEETVLNNSPKIRQSRL